MSDTLTRIHAACDEIQRIYSEMGRVVIDGGACVQAMRDAERRAGRERIAVLRNNLSQLYGDYNRERAGQDYYDATGRRRTSGVIDGALPARWRER